jgi:hypothetical protein
MVVTPGKRTRKMTAPNTQVIAEPRAHLELVAEPKTSVEEPVRTAPAPVSTDETLYLIGRPPLKGFLRFVSGHAIAPDDEGALSERWHQARDLVAKLETEEAGIADDPAIRKLGPEYEPLLRALLRDPLIQGGFNTVPTEIAMVELDKLVVYQEHIDVTYARGLEQRLGASPGRDDLFRTCLPYDHPQPPVKWSRMHGDRYVFMSPSNDLRYLGGMSLEPEHITGHPRPGNLVGVVGIPVGFGSNFMNAIRVEKRLILNNGSHRAYALRRMGITHVPCIVQHCSTRDEMEIVACSQVRRNPDLYLTHKRPPMLRDYLDPRLHMVMPVRRRLRQVTVKFEVEEDFVPAM